MTDERVEAARVEALIMAAEALASGALSRTTVEELARVMLREVAAEAARRALAVDGAEAEGRAWGLAWLAVEHLYDTAHARAARLAVEAHRSSARAAELEQSERRLRDRLGRALDDLKGRDEEDQRHLDMAFGALKAVEPVVRPCGYLVPCGKCPSCRYREALEAFRARHPEDP